MALEQLLSKQNTHWRISSSIYAQTHSSTCMAIFHVCRLALSTQREAKGW